MELEPEMQTDSEMNSDDVGEGVLEESELLLELIRSIVRRPEKVSVKCDDGQGPATLRPATILTIHVDPEDRGHVIGKNHQTWGAIIHLFTKAAFMDGRKILIQLDGHDSRHDSRLSRGNNSAGKADIPANMGPVRRPYQMDNRSQAPILRSRPPRIGR